MNLIELKITFKNQCKRIFFPESYDQLVEEMNYHFNILIRSNYSVYYIDNEESSIIFSCEKDYQFICKYSHLKKINVLKVFIEENDHDIISSAKPNLLEELSKSI